MEFGGKGGDGVWGARSWFVQILVRTRLCVRALVYVWSAKRAILGGRLPAVYIVYWTGSER